MLKLRNIYLYLVSFVSLMLILIGLIFTIQNLTDLIFPTNYYYDTAPIDKTGQTEEEKKAYEESQRRNEQNQRTLRGKAVAKSTSVVVVALPSFIYHWRKIEKEKREK